MFIPIRTSIIPRQTPYANYGLIVLNVIIFVLTYHPHIVFAGFTRETRVIQDWAQIFVLNSQNLQVWQFISYAFLHASKMHIFGNMYFLYIFGNNVNDRLGNVGYICFYLAGAIASGVGHTLFSNNPVLGASGAIAAVTGAYLVLYPKSIMTILYFFFFIGTIEIPVIWLILLKMIILDNIITPTLGSNMPIAYDAHLTGYGFGIVSIMLLLWTRLLHNDHSTMLSMITQWRRRSNFKQELNKSGYDPFSGFRVGVDNSKEDISPKEKEKQEKILNLRLEITRQLNIPDISGATHSYLKLIAIDDAQVLAKQHQLDIANHLMSIGSWDKSAKAYEKFKLHYPKYEHIEQVKLMLGIIYTRYLGKADLAIKNLQDALDGLTDPDQIKMCREELEKNTLS